LYSYNLKTEEVAAYRTSSYGFLIDRVGENGIVAAKIPELQQDFGLPLLSTLTG
jgi:hypothetical protein